MADTCSMTQRMRFNPTSGAVLAIIAAILVASSWLVFPYMIKGQNLLRDVGSDVKKERLMKSISIGQFLTRTTFGSGEAQVDMLYAPPRFFEVTDRADAVREYRPDLYLVFIATETTHVEDLPSQLPQATLIIDGEAYDAHDVEGPIETYHHRSSTIRFARFDQSGKPLITDATRKIQLQLLSKWDPNGNARTAAWDLPLQYPDNIRQPTGWTPIMVLAIAAGLLSFVLTPCLLQLIFVYIATLTGLTMDRIASANAAASIQTRMLKVAIAFVFGFSLLFTAIGALIGWAGKEMQLFLSVWSPTITVIAGLLVITMGVWIGFQSGAPVVCRIGSDRLRQRLSGSASTIGAAVTAIGFSLGCMTCFGGAIIATLLIYVGSLGSAVVGASVMFAFSLGIVVPFLLAALFLSRALPAMARLQQIAPAIGFASMVIMIAFGLVLLTDNFHVVSDLIYPYLGLG